MMPPEYHTALNKRLSTMKSTGKLMDFEGAKQLFPSFGKHGWLAELFTEFPLVGMRIGIKDPELEEIMFELADADVLSDLNKESYPGMYLFGKGFVVIGYGQENAGDVLILDCNGESIIPYQLWHDVSQDPDELITALRDEKPGARRLAANFENLIANGVMMEPWE